MIIAFGNPVFDAIRTPWVSTRGRVLSGCATNAALIYARLGGNVTVVGRTGMDRVHDYHAYLLDTGIKSETEVCGESGGFGLDYDRDGNRELTVLGRAEPITQIPAEIDDARMVFLGPVMQELPFDLIRRIRARTRAPIVLDPQGLLRRTTGDGRIEHFKPDGIEEICALCDVVKPNELETRILTGVDPRQDLDRAAAILRGWGIATVVITLAEEGALIVDPEGHRHRIAALPTLAIDSTGAGDSFAGGLMFARVHGHPWPEAGRLATACSSTMIAHCGPDFELTLTDARARAAGVAVTTTRASAARVA
ncbi:MAG: carbohydrate kinase family protein [Candidatus Zixiibacteriota bacterium]